MTIFLDPLFLCIQLKLAKNHSLQEKDQRNSCMPFVYSLKLAIHVPGLKSIKNQCYQENTCKNICYTRH